MLKFRKNIRKKYDSIDINTKFKGVIIIFICMILFLIFTPKTQVNPSDNKKVLNEGEKLLNTLSDNYTLDISINNENNFTYNVYKDLKIYYINNKTYVLYNNNVFEYNNDTFIKSNDDIYLKYYVYYYIDFIKYNLGMGSCNNESVEKTVCVIKVSDFVNNKNKITKDSYRIEDNNKLTFNLLHNDVINEIEVDYSYVNKIINAENNKLLFNIKISNINQNDYSDLYNKLSSYVESNPLK